MFLLCSDRCCDEKLLAWHGCDGGCLPHYYSVSPQAVSELSGGASITHAIGCIDGPGCSKLNVATSVAAAKAADVAVLVVGLKTNGEGSHGCRNPGCLHGTNGEGIDRRNITLPGQQQALCEAVIAAGKPTVLVVIGGGSISIDFAKDSSQVAVISVGAGGYVGAEALAEVLFGIVNPSGRLPHTIYNSRWEQLTPMADMSMQAGPGRSYRWLDTAASPALWCEFLPPLPPL